MIKKLLLLTIMNLIVSSGYCKTWCYYDKYVIAVQNVIPNGWSEEKDNKIEIWLGRSPNTSINDAIHLISYHNIGWTRTKFAYALLISAMANGQKVTVEMDSCNANGSFFAVRAYQN